MDRCTALRPAPPSPPTDVSAAILARLRGAPLRRRLGWGIVVLGALALAAQLVEAGALALMQSPALADGVAAAGVAGAATGLGALAVLWVRRPGARLQVALLGASAGVMAAAALLGLLLPAWEVALARTAGAAGALALVGAALAAGALALRAADRALPHAHPALAVAGTRRLWLVVIAIALHNLPEGLAVGAGYAGGEALGLATAIGIGVQNIPEGLVVAAALALLGFAPGAAVALATLTGLAEPLAALVGGAAAGLAAPALPLALAGAAGAMLFVVGHELLPQVRASRHAALGMGSALAGFGALAALALTL